MTSKMTSKTMKMKMSVCRKGYETARVTFNGATRDSKRDSTTDSTRKDTLEEDDMVKERGTQEDIIDIVVHLRLGLRLRQWRVRIEWCHGVGYINYIKRQSTKQAHTIDSKICSKNPERQKNI